jgi:integrase
MPVDPVGIPAYRRHKASGQAVVTLNGKDIYLGRYGTAASKRRYEQLIAEWLAAGRQLPVDDQQQLTVTELIARFWQHAKLHYRHPDGTPTSELNCYKSVLRILRQLYGSIPAAEFSPLKLKARREVMIQRGWSRKNINIQVCRIRHVFRWASDNELIPPSVYHGVKAVSGLQKGRSNAKEPEPIKPVPEEHVNAIREFVSRQVWAMIQLQLLTGMRPGEVVIMRTCDLDTSGCIWLYRPVQHKLQHHGLERIVYLGPRAQEVLKPWLRPNLQEYLFQPREAEQARNAKRRQARKTLLWPSHIRAPKQKHKRRPKRQPRDHYDVAAYRRAIVRACERAGVPKWTPNRLRHAAATRLRKE